MCVYALYCICTCVILCKALATHLSDTYQLDNCKRDCDALTENSSQYPAFSNQYSVINPVDNGSVVYKVKNNMYNMSRLLYYT